MSSYKDTFEPRVYAPRTFAGGAFRGAFSALIDVPGIEYAADDWRIHSRLSDARLHFASPDWRLHYRGDEQ